MNPGNLVNHCLWGYTDQGRVRYSQVHPGTKPFQIIQRQVKSMKMDEKDESAPPKVKKYRKAVR